MNVWDPNGTSKVSPMASMKVNRRLFNVAEWRPVAVPSGAGLQIVEIQSGKHRISRFIDFLQIQKGMLIVWGPDVLTRSFPKGKLNAIESVFRQSQFLRREIELKITAHNGIAVDSCYCHHHRHHHHHQHHHHHLFCTTRWQEQTLHNRQKSWLFPFPMKIMLCFSRL